MSARNIFLILGMSTPRIFFRLEGEVVSDEIMIGMLKFLLFDVWTMLEEVLPPTV